MIHEKINHDSLQPDNTWSRVHQHRRQRCIHFLPREVLSGDIRFWTCSPSPGTSSCVSWFRTLWVYLHYFSLQTPFSGRCPGSLPSLRTSAPSRSQLLAGITFLLPHIGQGLPVLDASQTWEHLDSGQTMTVRYCGRFRFGVKNCEVGLWFIHSPFLTRAACQGYPCQCNACQLRLRPGAKVLQHLPGRFIIFCVLIEFEFFHLQGCHPKFCRN